MKNRLQNLYYSYLSNNLYYSLRKLDAAFFYELIIANSKGIVMVKCGPRKQVYTKINKKDEY